VDTTDEDTLMPQGDLRTQQKEGKQSDLKQVERGLVENIRGADGERRIKQGLIPG
jgi:hypothetical protein